MKPEVLIEFPSQGTTYCRQEYGVYEYSVYSNTSVLAGQERRVFLDSFPTLEEAQAAYPEARVIEGSAFHEINLNYLPGDDDPDPYGDAAEAARDL